MHNRIGMIGGALLAMASAGCFSTWDVAPRSLTSLNGYQEPATVEMVDTSGDGHTFDKITELRFNTADGAPPVKAKFSSIQVNGSALTGTMRPDARPFAIDLAKVNAVEARRYSALKTGLAIGIPVGATVVLGIVASVILATSGGSTVATDSSALHRRK
jgi:hypothetical protein